MRTFLIQIIKIDILWWIQYKHFILINRFHVSQKFFICGNLITLSINHIHYNTVLTLFTTYMITTRLVHSTQGKTFFFDRYLTFACTWYSCILYFCNPIMNLSVFLCILTFSCLSEVFPPPCPHYPTPWSPQHHHHQVYHSS